MKHDVNGDGEVGGVALTVLGTNGMPSDTQIPNTVTPGTCQAEVAAELSIIASHPNVPPFISRQLIQRFVTSNPSPAYLQRVATVMDTAGKDLGDVIKAILTDPRSAQSGTACERRRLRQVARTCAASDGDVARVQR